MGLSWIRRLVAPWADVLAGALAVAQLGAMVLFGWLALELKDWTAGALAVLAAVGASWQVAQVVRIRRAKARGAVPLALAGPPRATGAQRGTPVPRLAVEATHVRGWYSQKGMVVMAGGVTAFLPTGPSLHGVARLLVGLLTLRVIRTVMVELPDSGEQLLATAQAKGGFVLDESWRWSPMGGLLVLPGREEALVAQLPSPYSERWETMPDDPAARRRAMRKVFLAAFAVAVALVGAGTAAWQIAGDMDYLVAGLCYGAVVGVAAGAAYLVIARRQPRR